MIGAIVKMKSASRAAKSRSRMQETESVEKPCSQVSRENALKFVHAVATAVVIGQGEQFTPTGNFGADFRETCSRAGLPTIDVVPRPSRPTPPTASTTPETAHATKPTKEDKNSKQVVQEQPKESSNHELKEPLPATYAVKEKYDYFKPRVEVKNDAEGSGAITEMYIRGWKIDKKMLDVMAAILPHQEKLETINLWNVGLDDDTLEALVSLITRLSSLQTLCLDGNSSVALHRYCQLLDENSTIQHLSLRHSYVNDAGAELIGNALARNKTLLSLNLAFNKITCEGAKAIAKGMRMNRTLLILNLSNNRIANEGAQHIAKILAKYPLTHDEIVQRRKLLSKRNGNESVSPTRSIGQTSSKESTRPQSVRSSSHLGKEEKKSRDKGSNKRKDGPSGKQKDEAKGKKGGSSSDSPSKSKQTKKANAPKQEKGKQHVAENEIEEQDVLSPLLDILDEQPTKGEIWVTGNQTLINLNLARNSIGEKGLQSISESIDYQTRCCRSQSDLTNPSTPGLLKVSLQNNAFPRDSLILANLIEVMKTRNPCYKQMENNPELTTNEEAR